VAGAWSIAYSGPTREPRFNSKLPGSPFASTTQLKTNFDHIGPYRRLLLAGWKNEYLLSVLAQVPEIPEKSGA
jgi:hypothetical protein